jgi:hypothetical protein
MYETDFDGVFKFTNATTEDFVFFWNNKEYLFPAGTCCPMIIANESLENIQEIRKKAAYKLATREFYKGKQYKSMSKMGNGLPPIFDEKVLEPWIDECLKPLPMAKAVVKEGKREKVSFRGSKAISDKENPNFVFKDESEDPVAVGAMPNTEI